MKGIVSMKRMLLCSAFSRVSYVLEKLDGDFKGKTVTYIYVSAFSEKLRRLMGRGTVRLRKMGLFVEELRISRISENTLRKTILKNDYIYVSGGNTFSLLQKLKHSGAGRIISEAVENGKLYIGESAGAAVTSPHIGYLRKMDNPNKAPNLRDYRGLALTDFYVVPHGGSLRFGKAVESIAIEYSDKLNLNIINDSQAIIIENENVKVL